MFTVCDNRIREVMRAALKAEEIDALGAILQRMCSCHEGLFRVASGMQSIRDATRKAKTTMKGLAEGEGAASGLSTGDTARADLVLAALEDVDSVAEAGRMQGEQIAESAGYLMGMIEDLYELLTQAFLIEMDGAVPGQDLGTLPGMPVAS